jgi:hypothetical protein
MQPFTPPLSRPLPGLVDVNSTYLTQPSCELLDEAEASAA